MFRNLLISIFALVGCVAFAQPYSGRVYRDADGDGTFSRGDRPIAGVKVSDGINVTRTDKDGAFTLPGYDDTRFIFVTVPSGYFALHPWIPAGSAQSYDFALQPRKEGEVIRFAQIADNETPESWRWVQALKDYARNEHLDFILHSGDICYEPGIRFHGDSVTTATMGVPVYYTMGNHDLMKKVPVPEYLYQEHFGPVWYSFEAGNTHFIVLPMYIGDGKPTYTAEQNYRWLKNDLAHVDPDQNIVVVTHYNNTLGEQLVFKSKEGSIRFKDDDRFIAHILGHWHINHQRLIDGRIRYIVTSPSNKGGKDHSPSAFRVISIDRKGNISSENIYSYSRMNMAIVSPSRTARAGAPLRISVNAYNTAASVRRVDYTVTDAAGKNWAKGTLAPNTDWNYSTDVDLSKAPQGDTLTLKVTATCSDGTSRTLERRFAFGTLPSVNVSGQWAQLRGNEMHNDTIGTDQPVRALQLLWTANAGGNIFMTSPIVAQGKVFVATMDNNLAGRSAVVAFDAATGAKVWSHPTVNSVKNTIVYASGKVFAMDTEGTVYALDADTGQVVWKKTLEVGLLPAAGAGLVVRGDTLYAGDGQGLSALNVADGGRYWRNTDFSQATGTTVSMTLAGNTLLSSQQWSALYGTDIKTGKLRWSLGGPDLRYRDGSPAVYDGMIFVASNRKLYEITPQGDFRHLRHTGHIFQGASCPLLTDSLFIIGTSTEGLLAFDRENFDLRWQLRTDPAIFYTAPYSWHEARTVDASAVQVGQDALLFGASDGLLRLARIDNGEVLWHYDFATPVFTTPAGVDGVVFVADFAGNVYAFSL